MILYIFTVFCESVLFTTLIVRPGRKVFPFFRSLVFFLFPKDLFLLILTLLNQRDTYFYAYYTLVIVESLLMISVVLEVIRELFLPRDILPEITYKEIIGSVIAVTFVCLCSGVLFPCRYPDLLLSSAWTLERSTTALQCGCLWIAVVFARRLGIPWRKRLLGITAGLVFQTTIQTIVLANRPSHFSGSVVMISGVVTMLTWTLAILATEPALISLNEFNVSKFKKGCASITHSYIGAELVLDERCVLNNYGAKKIRRIV